jgi:hypothetical protein
MALGARRISSGGNIGRRTEMKHSSRRNGGWVPDAAHADVLQKVTLGLWGGAAGFQHSTSLLQYRTRDAGAGVGSKRA